MRRLMLLRHAKAERSQPGGRDRDRRLDDGGRRDAPRIGAYLASQKLAPDAAVVSPAARTRETWELVAQALDAAPDVTLVDRLYEGAPDAILEVIKQTAPDAKALLVIGHNPGLHALAVWLIASGDHDARARLSEALPTSGLAVIDFNLTTWASLHPNSGRLERFVTPRDLAAESE